jgi:hypothetical protein
MMTTKAFLMVLLLLPSTTLAQGVPAYGERSDLFQFYMNNFLQKPGMMQEFDVFKDGDVLYGFINLHGTSTSATQDPIELARTVTGHVRRQFAIPNEYQWVLEQGGFYNVPPVRTIADLKMVQFTLTIDGVPLEDANVQVMVDEQGHTRTISISIPRLRPEIVKAVRGAKMTPAEAQAAVRADAKALPHGNKFSIDPSKNVDWEHADLKKVALARPPYVLYTCMVDGALYTVNATTGKVMGKTSMDKE